MFEKQHDASPLADGLKGETSFICGIRKRLRRHTCEKYAGACLVEPEGIEPSSKRRTNLLSTRLAFYQIFVRSLRRKQS